MKKLTEILAGVRTREIIGDTSIEINKIVFDSRIVSKSDLFVAVKGTVSDGHDFISKAEDSGAIAIVCESLPIRISSDKVYILVENTSQALGQLASNYFDNPSGKLTLIAVTGTNGKTTCVSLLYGLFRKMGEKVGVISTVNNLIEDKVVPATHTTPDAIKINELLSQMVDEGCSYCFMEASSHAIDQDRMFGLKITGAIFTNISHDHLDYHKTFSAYIEAKKKLFDHLPSSAFALTNLDDKNGKVMLQNTKALKSGYSIRGAAEFRAKVVSNTLEGIQLELAGQDVWFKLVGKFNAYNILAAYGCATLLGEDSAELLKALSDVDPAPGRFDRVSNELGIKAFVDYAHTPDALENVLGTINECRTGNEQLITVVGCGGNRDKSKRPKMAQVATKLSDKVIFTSDNPRDEDPNTILEEMQAGVGPVEFKKALTISDRKEAIKTAVLMAEPNDIILVAGKGHEKYQEIKGVKHPFDDKDVLENLLTTAN